MTDVGALGLGAVALKDAAAETKIVSGVLTVTQALMVVGAESGTSDDLTTISLDSGFNVVTGYNPIIFLKATTGDSIVIKDGSANIETNTGSDVTLTGEKMVMLVRITATAFTEATTKWICFS